MKLPYSLNTLYKGFGLDIIIRHKCVRVMGGSGVGKTLLFGLLNDYFKEHKISCTYVNYKFSSKDTKLITDYCKGAQVVICDNADLYMTVELAEQLQRQGSIIIMACHNLIDVVTVSTPYTLQRAGVNIKLSPAVRR